MDVDCFNFKTHLPLILTTIAKSRFVAFDLELSGIPSRQTNRPRGQPSDDSGKQTLQQRYSETKAAAERFQILQIGLTCVEEDIDSGKYVMHPFNLTLSPLIDKRLKLEREFTYRSGAVDFLLGHNFQFDAAFTRGITYLSFEEEANARAIAIADWGGDTLPDIGIRPDDVENLDLMRRVREEVLVWQQQDKKEQPAFLNIAPTGSGMTDSNTRGFNGYQKRLIHQLIRAEYPDIVSVSRQNFVQLLPLDHEREELVLTRKRKVMERNLIQQIGMRWVIEAMCNKAETVLDSDIVSPISASTVFRNTLLEGSPAKDKSSGDLPHQFQKLSNAGTILVGHNLFLDLIYLYQCFFGPLPELVEDFQSIMGLLFPLIIDTKYLADMLNANSPRYKSSLEEIDQELSKGPSPSIEIPPEYNKYYTSTRLHEAGFDSFLTAKVVTRLAAKMTGYNKTFVVDTPAADLDGHAASSEDNAENNTADIYLDPHVDVFGNVTNRPSTGDGSQPVLTLNKEGEAVDDAARWQLVLV
ncbi:MAG: hypothetical protein OHK93_008221 [Ramalina farinacea]|uniref:Uncharacterized protein n=1 Tax=Ramalina farinacea TaxID=258253 RepID=A0AA43QP50_9LECA|nr:hypothetical protein [Ramalina farinacea]